MRAYRRLLFLSRADAVFGRLWLLLAVLAASAMLGCSTESGARANAPPPVLLFRALADYHREAGYDISAAEQLDAESRAAFARGDRALAADLLRSAIAELDKLGPRPDMNLPPVRAGGQPRDRQLGQPGPMPRAALHGELSEPDQNSGLTRAYSNAPFMIPKKMRMIEGAPDEPLPAGTSIYNDSPFGIYGPYEIMFDEPVAASGEELNSLLIDLGVTWVQEIPLWLAKLPPTIGLYTRVGREGRTVPSSSIDYDSYAEALKKRIASFKHRVKIYEICTEPDGLPPPMGWRGLEKEYAKLLRVSYETIKQACPDSIVVFGGLTGVGARVDETMHSAHFLEKALAAGAAGAFDAFAFKQHMHNADEYEAIGKRMKLYGSIMKKYGLDLKAMPVFIEVATHDGHARFPEKSPMAPFNSKLKPQTEREQAAGLVKTYIYSLAQGVDKIFWDLLVEHHRFGGSEDNPFDLYGLVHNQHNADGKKGKKLAYFAYKKMAELLAGADFSSVDTLKDESGLRLYRFAVGEASLWVAWSNSGPQPAVIELPRGQSVTTVKSVPSAAFGNEVADYSTAFMTKELKPDESGRIVVMAENEPIYIIEH